MTLIFFDFLIFFSQIYLKYILNLINLKKKQCQPKNSF